MFGHAGDGNFHPTFVMDRDDPTAEQRIDAVRAEHLRSAHGLGGTVTGEHGTGVAKRGYLSRSAARPASHVTQARSRRRSTRWASSTPARSCSEWPVQCLLAGGGGLE